MKIAIVSDAIYPFTIGGSEIRNYEVARRLVKMGHEVHIYGAKLWEGKDNILLDGIKVHGVHKIDKLYNKNGKRKVEDYAFLAIKLCNRLRKENFDVIDCVAFNPFNCLVCKYLSLRDKAHLVLTWHQYFGNYYFGYFGRVKGMIAWILERVMSKLTSNNLAVSDKTRKDLKGIGLKKNVAVIENGVDVGLIKCIKVKRKKYDFVFVGRLNYQKNLVLLIKSAQILKNEIKDFKICIVGDGADKEKLIDLTRKLGLKENFVFLGQIKDRRKVFEIMKESEVFVLPSYLEGFPLVIVEANACGLPLIITNHKWNGAKSYIKNMQNGLVVECNENDFAQAMNKLISDGKMRDRLSASGVNMSKGYDWDLISKKVEEYYQMCLF